jgi:hypothetical protein
VSGMSPGGLDSLPDPPGPVVLVGQVPPATLALVAVAPPFNEVLECVEAVAPFDDELAQAARPRSRIGAAKTGRRREGMSRPYPQPGSPTAGGRFAFGKH